MSPRSVPITGMTCSTCEETVSTTLLTLPGVESAVANRRTGRVELTGAALPTDAEVSDALTDTPYGVGTRPWLTRERHVWRDLVVALAVVGLLALAIWALGLGEQLSRLTTVADSGSAIVVLALGVAASVSTCMALVGGLVVSLAASTPASGSTLQRLVPHLAFNAGRIVGFGILGALVGLVGRSLAPAGPLLTALVLVSAAVMLLVGVRLTEISPQVSAWQLALPGRWGRWARAGAGSHASNAKAAGLGAATFFLPCGFTQAVQLYALASGSAREGAIVMALFAVGTAPGLLAAGAAASNAQRGSGRALRAVGVAVIAFGLVTAGGAITQLVPGLRSGQVLATERTENVVDAGGVQIATSEVVWNGYSPSVMVVYADEPVEWNLEPEARGCQSVIDGSSLGLGQINAWEATTVEFTLDEAGTYPISCSMGMFEATIIAIDRPSS